MHIALPESLLTIPRTTAALSRSWAVGQLLTATVIGRDGENSIRLRIGDDIVRAETRLPLRPGSDVKLQVVNNGTTPTLRALSAAEDRRALVIKEALKQVLPRQQPLRPTFERLDQLLRSGAGRSDPLPADLLRSAASLQRSLATVEDLVQPTRLAHRMRESGIGLEARLQRQTLTRSPAVPRNDLKWQLMALRQVVARLLAEPPAGQTPASVERSGAPAHGDPRAATRANAAPAGAQNTRPATAATRGADEPSHRVFETARGAGVNEVLAARATTATPALPRTAPATVLERSAAAQTTQAGARVIQPETSGAGALHPPDEAEFPHPKASVAAGADANQRTNRFPAGPGQRLANDPIAEMPPTRRDLLLDLHRHTDSAIARIQSNQLQSLAANGDQPLPIVVELPVRTPDGSVDMLRVEIEGEAHPTPEGGDPPMVVTIQIAMADSRPLIARLKLQGRDVAVSLWTEDPSLRRQIASQTAWLASRLAAAGLAATSIVMAPLTVADNPRYDGTPLVDTAI